MEDKRAAIHKVPGAILFRKELSDPMAKGKKVKTTHFGASRMSDYTNIKTKK